MTTGFMKKFRLCVRDEYGSRKEFDLTGASVVEMNARIPRICQEWAWHLDWIEDGDDVEVYWELEDHGIVVDSGCHVEGIVQDQDPLRL